MLVSAYREPKYPALHRQWFDDPQNTIWIAASPIIPDTIERVMGRSSASSCHANTRIALPWSTSPEPNVRKSGAERHHLPALRREAG
jgi:hypothetical protein